MSPRIGLARNPSPADLPDDGERIRAWLDAMDAKELGSYLVDWIELHENRAHYDAFVDSMWATFDRVNRI